MANYALIKNGRVENIIVAESLEFAQEIVGQEITVIELSENQPVSINWAWEDGKFVCTDIPQQPVPSWTLNENLIWTPPVPMPTDKPGYLWNEETLSWYIPAIEG